MFKTYLAPFVCSSLLNVLYLVHFLSCFMILVMNIQQEIILLNILYRTIYLHMCMRGVCIIVHILGFTLKLIFNKSFFCLHKLLVFIIYITIYNTSTVIIGPIDSI